MKKLFALLLTLLMLLAMGTTAFAAEETGSITVNGTTKGKTYDVYKIFDLTYSGDAVSYTIDTDWTAFFNGDGADYIVAADTEPASLSPIVVNGVTKYINITNENVAEFAQAALAYAGSETADDTKEAEGSTIAFEGLALGYYLVYPQGAADITTGNASICSLTSTTPNATVQVKAEYPTIEKEVNDTNVDVGQTITYTVTGKVPDTTGYTAYDYIVEDTMSDGLTFNSSVANMSITIGGTAITDVTPVYADNGFTLTFDMTRYQEDSVGKEIVITYRAVVNENAVNGTEGNPNEAVLIYSNDPGDSNSKMTNPPVIVKVYTAGIEILKYDAADETKATTLAGAKFALKDADGKYYKFTAATETTPENVEWVDDVDDATTVATDDNGQAWFKGLESGEYALEELEAPTGYNMLTEDVKITINHDAQTATTYQIAEIANSTGAALPETGGIGTTIFYIVGGLLMAGAVVLLITKKKLSAKAE